MTATVRTRRLPSGRILATLLSERVLTLSGGRQTSTHNVDPIRDVLLFVVR